jgi:excisionase family DNA binding protein
MLTTEEAAEYFGTTVRHHRRLVSDHELSRYKVEGGTDSPTSTWRLGSINVESRAHVRFCAGV